MADIATSTNDIRKGPQVEVKSGEAVSFEDLPPFYRNGVTDFQKEAQRRDPSNRHRWVQVSPRNQQMKRFKGWEPIEDRVELTRLGIDLTLINARGRAQWMDTELWRMPMRRAEAIRKHIAGETLRRRGLPDEEVKAMIADVSGRSKGQVEPFLFSDIPDRIPSTPNSKPALGGKK